MIEITASGLNEIKNINFYSILKVPDEKNLVVIQFNLILQNSY